MSLCSSFTSTVRSFNSITNDISPYQIKTSNSKPKRYCTDLSLLSSTLTVLNIPSSSIINYSLDEGTQLSGAFRESVTKFLFQLTHINEKVDQMLHSNTTDYTSVS